MARKSKKEKRSLRLVTDPKMPFSYVEAYKSLRTNLNFISSTSKACCFVVTSALPEESKSNVAVNLAVTLAGDNKKVILVDCDLRKPVLHKYISKGHATAGLTDALTGQASLQDCVHFVKEMKIWLLGAGTIPPNPSEILGRDYMKQLIDVLRSQFDYVILDAPPVSVVTDAAILGRMADGAIMVVRSKYAPRQTIQLAKKRLEDVGVKIFGVVLTRFNPKKSRSSTGYSYSYDYGYGEK